MAQRSENTSKIIEDLKKQIFDLKSTKHQLKEVCMVKYASQSPKEKLEAANLRNQKYRLALKKLKRACIYITVGVILSVFAGL
jgi:hypothetical protein